MTVKLSDLLVTGGVDFQIGTILDSYTSPGAGYLKCDGSIYLKSAYPALASVVGSLIDLNVGEPEVSNWQTGSTFSSLTPLNINNSLMAYSYYVGGNRTYFFNGPMSTVALTPNVTYNAFCFGGGIVVALGAINVSNVTEVSRSTNNGTSFSVVSSTGLPNVIAPEYRWKIDYGNGVFVAILVGGNICAKSTDGITWSQTTLGSTTPVASTLGAIKFGNGQFIISNQGSTTLWYSTDATNWTSKAGPGDSIYMNSDNVIAITNNAIILSTPTSIYYISYDNGATWAFARHNYAINTNIFSANNNFIMSDPYSTYASCGLYVSSNGIDWDTTRKFATSTLFPGTLVLVGSTVQAFKLTVNGSIYTFNKWTSNLYNYNTATQFRVPKANHTSWIKAY